MSAIYFQIVQLSPPLNRLILTSNSWVNVDIDASQSPGQVDSFELSLLK